MLFRYSIYAVFVAQSMLARLPNVTLTHSFVANHIDYCNCFFVNILKVCTEKLQRVLNAAARVLTRETGLTKILCSDLQRLYVPERIKYKLCLSDFKCAHRLAPPYLSELCIPVTQIEWRRLLRSAARGQFVVLRAKLMIYGKRVFACARCWIVCMEISSWLAHWHSKVLALLKYH